MADILGIDLGTTNTVVAIWRDGEPRIVLNAEGYPLTPSVVALAPDGEWVVGHRARAIAEQDPQSVVYSIKRFIGRRFQEEVIQDELEKSHILYRVTESCRRQSGIEVTLGDKRLTPQEVSAKILQKIKADAEAYLEHKVTQAVITVPAYFHDSQRQATRDAGRIAGLEVKRVLNEPTAACLAFGYKKLAEKRKTIAVYDLGGGTFDISILEVGQGPFRVRATNGDTHLGGDDLDWLIVDWILEEIGEKKLKDNLPALARLRAAAERAKIALSDVDQVQVQVSGLFGPSPHGDVDLTLTKTRLEMLAEQFVARTLEPCNRALQDARLGTSAIQEVLLVGGQTRMPAVRQAVRKLFGIEPNTSVNPDEVVALGAAVQAAILAGEDTKLKLSDVVPLTLGVSTKGYMDALIPRNTWVPVSKTKMYSTAEDNQESVEIQIYQGERPMVADNVKLGSFILKGIEPAPRGEPQIEVTFKVDQDGILHVTGKDLRTGNFKEITITDSVRLSDEEIEGMIRDADEHAAEYAAQRRQIEAQEQSERIVEQFAKLLAEKEAALPADPVIAIREMLNAPPPDDWTARLTDLENLWQRVRKVGQ